MDVISQSDARTVEAVEGVHLTQLAVGDRMSVQHYYFEPGARVPEHSHEHEQVGYLPDGTLALVVDGDDHLVGPGDAYVIPSDEPHAAENRTDEPVEGVDIFAPPRPDPDWMD